MQVWSKSGTMVRQLVVIQLFVHNSSVNLERVGSPDPHEKFKFIKYASPKLKYPSDSTFLREKNTLALMVQDF